MSAGPAPALAGLDHVHMEVADRDAAAAWYARVLGLRPASRFAAWAEHPMGPLMLETTSGAACLALFARDPAAPVRDTTVALRTDGASFLAFRDRLPDLRLSDRDGGIVDAARVVEHWFAWSIYFTDPDGNRLELTTYDYDAIEGALAVVAPS